MHFGRSKREVYQIKNVLFCFIVSIFLTPFRQIAEPLLVLYCGLAIELLSRQPQFGARTESVLILFNNFLDDLQTASVDKNGGLLSAIGLSKKAAYPPRFFDVF